MSKKTSRSARVQQNQRDPIRRKLEATARPLVTSSAAVAEEASEMVLPPSVESLSETAAPLIPADAVATLPTPPRPAATGRSRTVAPTRRPVPTNRQAQISREDEFSFIRADLLTVLVLTILMFVLLIVLSFVLSR